MAKLSQDLADTLVQDLMADKVGVLQTKEGLFVGFNKLRVVTDPLTNKTNIHFMDDEEVLSTVSAAWAEGQSPGPTDTFTLNVDLPKAYFCVWEKEANE